MDRIANPFAVLVWGTYLCQSNLRHRVNGIRLSKWKGSHHDTAINGEKSQLVKSCNQVPTRGDVSSNEDGDGED